MTKIQQSEMGQSLGGLAGNTVRACDKGSSMSDRVESMQIDVDELHRLRDENATLRAAMKAHGEEAAKLVENRAAIAELVAVLKGYVDPGCGCIVCADAAAAITKHEPKP